jgi:dienelactone hydrolase
MSRSQRPQNSGAKPGSIILVFALLLFAGCADSNGTSKDPVRDPGALGPYPIGITEVVFYDESRDRTLLTNVWYPAAEAARDAEPSSAESYLPEDLAFLAANSTLTLRAVRDAALATDGPFPLILFSHGNNGINFQNGDQMEHLASHGFIVASPDHEGNTYFDNSGSPSGLSIDRPIDMIFLLDEMLRATEDPDELFYDWIDTTLGIGASGMSFGAFTVVTAADRDDRIVAVLPQVLTAPISEDYDTPTFLLLAEEDKTIGLDGNARIRDTYATTKGPKFLAELPDAGHFSPTISCYTGLGIGNADGCGEGERFADGSTFEFLEATEVWELLNHYSVAFFQTYQRQDTRYLSFLEENAFPEIAIYQSDPQR